MTIYYSLTFLLLTAEMVTFCVLVAPLPYTLRRRLFTFLSVSPIVAKVAYALKISFIFVAILFVDALQRMFRIAAESELAKKTERMVPNAQAESTYAARKFYSQRNTYLTGFTLFLSLVLTRVFYIILDLIHTQDEYTKLKKNTANTSKNATSTSPASSSQNQSQIDELKKKLAASEAKQRDFETLKKQAAQQAAEFNRLSDLYNEATGQKSDKRVD